SLILDGLTNRLQNMCGDVAPHALGINDKQPDLPVRQAGEIDHPDAASLAEAAASPPDFSATSASRNQITRIRMRRDPGTKGDALIFRPECVRVLHERRRLDNGIQVDYTSMTYFRGVCQTRLPLTVLLLQRARAPGSPLPPCPAHAPPACRPCRARPPGP